MGVPHNRYGNSAAPKAQRHDDVVQERAGGRWCTLWVSADIDEAQLIGMIRAIRGASPCSLRLIDGASMCHTSSSLLTKRQVRCSQASA